MTISQETINYFSSAVGIKVIESEIPDDPILLLSKLFEDLSGGDIVLLINLPEDPWPGILLQRGSDFWEDVLAKQLAGLLNVGGSTAEEEFYVETIPDAQGRHRVYVSSPGWPLSVLFEDLDPFVLYLANRWATEELGRPLEDNFRVKPIEGTEDDLWIQRDAYRIATNPSELSQVWDLSNFSKWVKNQVEIQPPNFTSMKDRSWILASVEYFVECGKISIPQIIDPSHLENQAVRRLLDEMNDLQQAIECGVIPKSIALIAEGIYSSGYANRQPATKSLEKKAAEEWI